jgi:hypothetical protein
MTTDKLRHIEYTYLFPVAESSGKSSSKRIGDISDLFRDANPYMFSGNSIPPLRLVNDFLAAGISSLGMGGGAKWQPFALTADEYSVFVRYLDASEGRKKFSRTMPVKLAEPPEEVRTQKDYQIWKIKALMVDPAHHFNTTKGFVVVDGVKERMSMGEALLHHPDRTFYVDRSN